MRQYTITEENDWEGEQFFYVMNMTAEEALAVKVYLKQDDSFSVEESWLTKTDIRTRNRESGNSYMEEYSFRKLPENWRDLVNDTEVELGNLFYKGSGVPEAPFERITYTYFDRIRGKCRSFYPGQAVSYVGIKGTVLNESEVLLDDGTTISSLETQSHKFKRWQTKK